MKYLIKFENMSEIKSYDIKSITGDDFLVKYEFTDLDGNDYLVQFKNDTLGPKSRPILGNSYELTYYVWDDEVNNWNVNKIVNGNVWRILHTVLGTVLIDFVTKRPWVTTIRIEGLAKEQEKDFVTQRTKMYLRHLRNNTIPGFRVENFGNNKINLIKNKI